MMMGNTRVSSSKCCINHIGRMMVLLADSSHWFVSCEWPSKDFSGDPLHLFFLVILLLHLTKLLHLALPSRFCKCLLLFSWLKTRKQLKTISVFSGNKTWRDRRTKKKEVFQGHLDTGLLEVSKPERSQVLTRTVPEWTSFNSCM